MKIKKIIMLDTITPEEILSEGHQKRTSNIQRGNDIKISCRKRYV